MINTKLKSKLKLKKTLIQPSREHTIDGISSYLKNKQKYLSNDAPDDNSISTAAEEIVKESSSKITSFELRDHIHAMIKESPKHNPKNNSDVWILYPGGIFTTIVLDHKKQMLVMEGLFLEDTVIKKYIKLKEYTLEQLLYIIGGFVESIESTGEAIPGIVKSVSYDTSLRKTPKISPKAASMFKQLREKV